ncbi:hypothetical protein AFK68_04040 [Hydrocoleum sp. CS-953]|uniref:hypothetical protein n=1 Tax=Hydrocoleum sp. CS-953 TaxID=1671698 RepID=UPI000B9A87E6|nr:hypothetical protein [Hydrocoleum sp. CS-953]OZH55527.1 hypothetical protein AFK68_04040 [Hydrocoleum sp. CS-953]
MNNTLDNARTQEREFVLKPFLQDIVQFPPWEQRLFVTSLKQPGLVIKIIPQVKLVWKIC